jgi:hypothetical protein
MRFRLSSQPTCHVSPRSSRYPDNTTSGRLHQTLTAALTAAGHSVDNYSLQGVPRQGAETPPGSIHPTPRGSRRGNPSNLIRVVPA